MGINTLRVYRKIYAAWGRARTTLDIPGLGQLLAPLTNANILNMARHDHPIAGLRVYVMSPITLVGMSDPGRPRLEIYGKDSQIRSIGDHAYPCGSDKAIIRGRENHLVLQKVHGALKLVIEHFLRQVSPSHHWALCQGSC